MKWMGNFHLTSEYEDEKYFTDSKKNKQQQAFADYFMLTDMPFFGGGNYIFYHECIDWLWWLYS